MATSRPFAYNPTHAFISGTTQTGDLAIGVTQQNYFLQPGGIIWWGGPNEESGYVICAPVPTGDVSTPLGNIGTVTFWRSLALTDIDFLSLVMTLSNRTVNSISGIQPWLDSMGYWSNWKELITKVGATSDQSYYYLNDQLWSWGYNISGQLGDNSSLDRYTPVRVLGSKKTFCSIVGGSYHTIGIDNRGSVWCWGDNTYGQLGDNSILSKCTPVSILGAKKTFCDITAYSSHTLGIDNKGHVWGWGFNGYGQLGDNSTTYALTPIAIAGSEKTFCKIDTGGYHTISIDNRGLVWGWGYNYFGQLGINSNVQENTPVSILGTKKTFCKITAGQHHTSATDNRELVWNWGYGYEYSPKSILGTKKTFCKIVAGWNYTTGIDIRGLVWSWGNQNNGSFGDNSKIAKPTPVSVLGTKKTFCDIAAGDFHTIAVEYNGVVWGWGYNEYGQLGDNSVTSKLTPVRVCNF